MRAEEISERDAAAREAVRTIVFGSLDAGSANFLTLGGKVALDSVDAEGFVFLGSAGYGMRLERDGAAPPPPPGTSRPLVARHTGAGAVLAGYQWLFPWGIAAAFVGPEAEHEVLASPFARARAAPRLGARLQGEVWTNPTPDTLLTGTLIAGSARGTAWGRLSWGTRVLGAFVGPEASLYADATGYRKWGAGAHATGLTWGDYSLRVSGGWLVEEQVGPARYGGYVALSAWTRL